MSEEEEDDDAELRHTQFVALHENDVWIGCIYASFCLKCRLEW